MIGQVSVAAATAVVGYDLFQDQQWNISSRKRTVDGLAICGSAAANDTEIDLFIDSAYQGNFYNMATGFPTRDHMIPLPGLYVPPGAKVAAIVRDAPATNPINVIVFGRTF